MNAKKIYLKTFGCQMNEYDSGKIADIAKAAAGYEVTDDINDADLVVFNTCSIREKAQEKVFSDLGRVRELKKTKPNLKIAVGGCVASQEGGNIVRRAPYVDVVFGPQTLHRLPELLKKMKKSTVRRSISVSRKSKSLIICRLRTPMRPQRLFPLWKAAASTAPTVSCLIRAEKSFPVLWKMSLSKLPSLPLRA